MRVYLCMAGENQITNWIPLLHLGAGNFDEIWLLIGLRDRSGAPDDREKAERPAEAFERMLSDRFGTEDGPRVARLVTHADSAGETFDRVHEKCAAGDLRVIANFTQGTRAMIFGALAALQQAERDGDLQARCFLYMDHPARLSWIHPAVEEPGELLRPEVRVALEDFLGLRGISEAYAERRAAGESRALARTEATERLFQLLTGDGPEDPLANARIRTLHGTVQRWRDQENQLGEEELFLARNELSNERVDLLETVLREEAGASLLRRDESGKGYWFRGKEAVRYFGGGWFEEYLFARARERLADRAEVRLGVHLRERAQGGADGELDLVIWRSPQAHLVECKAGIIGRGGVWREHPRVLANWRHVVLGPRGRVALVCAQLPDRDLDRYNLEREAALSHVPIFFGWEGVNGFLHWLDEL